MAKKDLTGKTVAILVEEGFEQVELLKPRKALDRIGARTQVVSPREGQVRGWNSKKWGKFVAVDVPLDSADPAAFDALLLPGGVMNPDKLRMNPKAVEFVKHFLRCGQTGRRNLPCSVDTDRSRGCEWPHPHFLAFAKDRYQECRWKLDRSGSCHRPRPGDKPNAR